MLSDSSETDFTHNLLCHLYNLIYDQDKLKPHLHFLPQEAASPVLFAIKLNLSNPSLFLHSTSMQPLVLTPVSHKNLLYHHITQLVISSLDHSHTFQVSHVALKFKSISFRIWSTLNSSCTKSTQLLHCF